MLDIMSSETDGPAGAGGQVAARDLLRRQPESPLDAIAFIQGAASEIGIAGIACSFVIGTRGQSRVAALQCHITHQDPVESLR